jgi:hypothetical protein
MMSKYHLVSQCDLAEISQLLLQYGQLTERALASKAAKNKAPRCQTTSSIQNQIWTHLRGGVISVISHLAFNRKAYPR